MRKNQQNHCYHNYSGEIYKYEQIFLDLESILEYTTSAIEYIKNDGKGLDKSDVLMYLSNVPEIIESINKRIRKVRY